MTNDEIIKKIKNAENPEEIIDIAKSAGANMTPESAADIFNSLKKSGELSDEEIDVSAGGCGSSSKSEDKGVKEDYIPIICPYCGYSSNFASFTDHGDNLGWHTRWIQCPSCNYVHNCYSTLENYKEMFK